MKSRTSFFSFTALKKNVIRFWPVWGLYTIFLLMVLFISGNADTPAITARSISELMMGMCWVNLIYGGICAIVLFGDLFVSRMCNALHAFPLRREGWLLTNFLSGMLFCLIPSLFVSITASVFLLSYAYIAWIWLAVSVLQFLFFFGTGALSALCAGNRLAMAAIYSIIHFITPIVFVIVNTLYEPVLYGIRLNAEEFFRYFPLAQFLNKKYVNCEYNPVKLSFELLGLNADAWYYLLICAGTGILSLLLAKMVYQKRHLESAGGFISLRPIAPIFLVIYTLGFGMLFYLFADLFEKTPYVFTGIGLLVGYFTGQMLLKRTVNVFTKKTVIGFVTLAFALAGSLLLTWFDPLRITYRVPETDQIQGAVLYTQNDAYYYQDWGYESGFEVTDLEELEGIRNLHKGLTANRENVVDGEKCEIQIVYAKKDGTKLTRYYEIDVNSIYGETVERYCSDMRYLFQINDLEELAHKLVDAQIVCYDGDMNDEIHLTADTVALEKLSIDTQTQLEGLLLAMEMDCANGNMAQYYRFHSDEGTPYYIDFEYAPSSVENSIVILKGITIYESCENTINYLRNLGK